MARAILEKVLILLPCQLKTQSLTHCRDLLGRNPRLKLIAYQGSVHNCFSASQKQSFWHGLKVNIQRVPAMFELHGSFPPRQRRGADKSGNIPDGTTWWPLDDIITHKHIFIYIDHIYIYMWEYSRKDIIKIHSILGWECHWSSWGFLTDWFWSMPWT